MIESPPKIRKEDFDKALRLSCDPKIADVVNEINRQYQYWTEIKYKHLPDKVLAQDVWACVKLSRMFAKTLEIGNYRFKLYVTDHMQQLCHEFDMNLGGYLGTQSFIPEADKNRYLIPIWRKQLLPVKWKEQLRLEKLQKICCGNLFLHGRGGNR